MPWVKGQSGNPAGRPRRGQSFADALRRALRERDPETKRTRLQQVAEAAVQKAIAGDLDAIRFIAERIDGKVPDMVQSDGQLVIRVEYVDEHADGSSLSSTPGPAAGDP